LEWKLDYLKQVIAIADEALVLGGRYTNAGPDEPMLGAVPELDSMGVVSLIGALEDRLGLSIEDSEIDGAVFVSFGSLAQFVQSKLGS
jgi:acyl carrier protein